MASGSFFALLDDIVFLTKIAASKTAPVLGDDLAVNAQSLSGDIKPDRELPVVWAVGKGSLLNKALIVPIVLLLSYFLPWLIQPLLILGGAFLCFEGAEKLLHFFDKDNENQKALLKAFENPDVDLVSFEQDKIKDAIKMDAVLSAEIIIIAMGTMQEQPVINQFLVLVFIALLMTIGVYGLVALLVKLDDIALYFMHKETSKNKQGLTFKLASGLLSFATNIMSFLSFFGMVACLLIGGEILSHGLTFIDAWLKAQALSSTIETLAKILISLTIGTLSGIVIILMTKLKKFIPI